MALIPPPYQVQSKNKCKIALAILAALVYTSSHASVIDNDYLESDDNPYNASFGAGATYDFDGINISKEIPSKWNQHVINVSTGSTLNINGLTYIHTSTSTDDGSDNSGVYAITSNNGTVNLNGNIDIVMTSTQGLQPDTGINAIYSLGENSLITIGSKGSTSKIWVLADKPDAISAKQGGDIVLASTNNQIVGSFDLFGQNPTPEGETSTISGTFSGETSYWFGDDTSHDNTATNAPVTALLGGIIPITVHVDFKNDYDKNNGELNLIFENGAQWSYLGLGNIVEKEIISGVTASGSTSYEKRISNITLRHDGIINLFDENLKQFWEDIGLLEKLDDGNYDVVHDYVQIGDLKGSGGIFRLDLDGIDKTQSDIVYIEGSTDPGLHYIEPYNLDRLESITPDNTLIFALVNKNAGVTFTDKINLEGETLYDYELQINHSTITEEDLLREEIASKEMNDKDNYEAGFLEGTKWFIERFVMHQSASAFAMNNAGFAAYDAAIEMDRRDRRLLQTFKDEETGLWVRARHGERGVKNEYGYQLNGFAVGTDYAFSDTNALGIAFSFEKGDTDFKSVVGDGNMKRYELAVYNTHDFGAPYLDFVGRLGIVKSDYTAYNQSRTLSTSGDFDQKYATLSAEAGYTLEDTNGVFIEPQVQVQVTYLKDYDYASDRNMHVSADSDYVVLSRVGLRGGRHFDSESLQGEVYGRADVYHQFTDGQDAIFRDTEQAMFQTWGTNKTFASIGLGSYLKAKSGWGVQFDVEKNLGGKSIDSWMITGQARYEF